MPYRNYDPDRWRDYDRDRSSDFDRGARGYEGRGGEMERPRMGGRGSAQDREWDRFDRDWDREAARGYGGEPWYGGATYGGRYTGGYGGGYAGYGGAAYGGFAGYGAPAPMRGPGRELRSESYAGRGPRDYRRSDERIREDVNDRLTRDPDIDASDVTVRVENGEVTLSGVVEDRRQKRAAEDCAEDIAGVLDVHNELKIRHGFLAGLTGEKADEREVSRAASRESASTTGTTTGASAGPTATSAAR